MPDYDFYEPTHCVMCGTTDLWGQFSLIKSPTDFVYVVCDDCRATRDPAWDANGFLLYPAGSRPVKALVEFDPETEQRRLVDELSA